MQRAAFFALAALLAAASGGPPAQALDQLSITEPNHVVGYLPLYVTQRRGFFA